MTRDELRACMDRRDEVARRKAALEAAHERHTDEGAALGKAAAQLGEDQRRVDPYDTDAVKDFNARLLQHNARIDALNRDAGDANARAAQYTLDAAAVTEQCGTRPYRSEDREAILQERKALKRP